MLNYVEKTYIGVVDKRINQRKIPRFPISTWNLHERVLKQLPRTNNSVESWHSQIQMGPKRHLTVGRLLHFLRLEQGLETLLVQLRSGDVIKRKKVSCEKDFKIYNLVKSYSKSNLLEFISDMSLNMGNQKAK